jgi:uncharacterized protein with HEPN domain
MVNLTPADLHRHRHEPATIIGFRNIAVHAYFSVDWRIVFVTVTDDLPALKRLIAMLVKP